MPVQPGMEWIPVKKRTEAPKISKLVSEMVTSAGEESVDLIADLMNEIIIEVVISADLMNKITVEVVIST